MCIRDRDTGVAASLSSVRLYLLPFLAAALAGVLVDRLKSATKFLTRAFIPVSYTHLDVYKRQW